MIGTLKCIGKDFGFIESDGIDYFFHRNDVSLKDRMIPTGAKLQFTTIEDYKGRIVVTSIEEIDKPQILTGKIFNYNVQGYGFIKYGNESIYFHESMFKGIPKNGLSVEFEKDLYKPGKVRAINVKEI